MNIEMELAQINWSQYRNGEILAKDLLTLHTDQSEENIQQAISRLDDKLGHQWVTVEPALESAMPFMIAALPKLSEQGVSSLLELFVFMARATSPVDPYYSIRKLDLSWTSFPKRPSKNKRDWEIRIRHQLLSYRPIFAQYLAHPDEFTFQCVTFIFYHFAEVAKDAIQDIYTALKDEENNSRRLALYFTLKRLNLEGNTDLLLNSYQTETDPVVQTAIAGLLINHLEEQTPKYIIDYLLELGNKNPQHLLKSEYYPDIVISVAMLHPDRYDELLKNYISGIKQFPRPYDGDQFLAFALCWGEKPDFNRLSPLQIEAIKAIFHHPSHKKGKFEIRNEFSREFSFFPLPETREGLVLLLKNNGAL